MKIIVYDDNEIKYMEGYVREVEMNPNFIDTTPLTAIEKSRILLNTTATIVANVENWQEYIELDPTTMKRIAKYNKEVEIQELDKKIKTREEKIKELDDIIYDKEHKVDRIKDFIANIYNIEMKEDEEEYWDE